MKRTILLNSLLSMMLLASGAATQEAFDSLTLPEAVTHALEHSLELSAIQAQIHMADADLEEAGLFPNPVLSGGMEAITFDTDRNDPEQRQDIVGITQPIPLGGARVKAMQVAQLERERFEAEFDALRIELVARTKIAFYEVVYYQEMLEQHDELKSILDEVLQVSKDRLKRGDIAEVEVIRVEADHERFAIESETARNHLANAKTHLAATMGNPEIGIGVCYGELEVGNVAIPLDRELSDIDDHPRALVWEKREGKALADVEEARAGAFPQLEIGANYRRFDATDQNTVDLTVGLTIPLFNRNQARVRFEEEDLERERLLIEREKNERTEDALKTLKSIQWHQERIARFRDSILPKIESASRISQTAYAAGDVSILEVLDSYRNLVESRLTYLVELAELNKSIFQLESLIGKQIHRKTEI